MDQGVVRVTGHVQDFNAGTQRTNTFGNLAPARFRQDHIRKQEMDITQMLFTQGFHIAQLFGDENRISLRREHCYHQFAHARVVFNKKDGLGARLGCRHRFWRDGFYRGLGLRQIYLEGRSLPDFAGSPDASSTLFNDSINHRQAEAGSLTWFLGCEKWFKNPQQSRVVDSHARVRNLQGDVRSYRRANVLPDEVLIEYDVPRFKHQPSALGHRITRVHTQIHQHLLELT